MKEREFRSFMKAIVDVLNGEVVDVMFVAFDEVRPGPDDGLAGFIEATDQDGSWSLLIGFDYHHRPVKVRPFIEIRACNRFIPSMKRFTTFKQDPIKIRNLSVSYVVKTIRSWMPHLVLAARMIGRELVDAQRAAIERENGIALFLEDIGKEVRTKRFDESFCEHLSVFGKLDCTVQVQSGEISAKVTFSHIDLADAGELIRLARRIQSQKGGA